MSSCNKYAKCYLCEETVYLFKKYSNKPSDNFFNKYRAVVKKNYVYCILCYKDVFVNKYITINKLFLDN
ncbi:ORF-124 [Agrotis segetum nucleopolyhedrovirus A]|uniref:ORF-124 n=1 Tax=Agrotis segetum nuclear polyhedrosis virus TaxID=1962501 RepID=Q287E8_NPVAS|nr:ORF-124 [Agrotis segetum nucleopolyhedrovirus A]AAZ38290.1 ORF-124 [Agrotis segetum nucleopolyhedrovirus A]